MICDRMKIFLIGFMGSGKTTLGKALSGILSHPFMDLDELITARERATVHEIFMKNGEVYFRNVEKEVLTEVIAMEQFILATGGGTPCFFDNMDLMNESGLTIYFRLSASTLYKRLKNISSSRPLISNYNSGELRLYINKKLSEREEWYLKSKLAISEAEQNPWKLASIITDYNPGTGLL